MFKLCNWSITSRHDRMTNFTIYKGSRKVVCARVDSLPITRDVGVLHYLLSNRGIIVVSVSHVVNMLYQFSSRSVRGSFARGGVGGEVVRAKVGGGGSIGLATSKRKACYIGSLFFVLANGGNTSVLVYIAMITSPPSHLGMGKVLMYLL